LLTYPMSPFHHFVALLHLCLRTRVPCAKSGRRVVVASGIIQVTCESEAEDEIVLFLFDILSVALLARLARDVQILAEHSSDRQRCFQSASMRITCSQRRQVFTKMTTVQAPQGASQPIDDKNILDLEPAAFINPNAPTEPVPERKWYWFIWDSFSKPPAGE
jgi:hypothetical protein